MLAIKKQLLILCFSYTVIPLVASALIPIFKEYAFSFTYFMFGLFAPLLGKSVLEIFLPTTGYIAFSIYKVWMLDGLRDEMFNMVNISNMLGSTVNMSSQMIDSIMITITICYSLIPLLVGLFLGYKINKRLGLDFRS